jgi:hypothetical protein
MPIGERQGIGMDQVLEQVEAVWEFAPHNPSRLTRHRLGTA